MLSIQAFSVIRRSVSAARQTNYPVMTATVQPPIVTLRQAVDYLNEGKVGVIRTDTLYGLVARADNQAAVERIFSIKQRSPDKPVLVLIANQANLFDEYETAPFYDGLWPGKNTVILPAPSAPEWITRGTRTVAYRLPDDKSLQYLLEQTGPLVAPSANPEGQPPAATTGQAIDYFGTQVDFYVDGGEVTDDAPSRLLRPRLDGTMERLR